MIVQRARQLARQQGLATITELAKKTKYTVSQIARVFKGEQPVTHRMLFELAYALGATPEYLEHGIEPDADRITEAVETYRVGAGTHFAVADDPPADSTPWPNPKALCAFRVDGDSMEPVARDGQVVIASKAAWPHSGDLAYVELEDGTTMFRRVQVLDADTKKESWILQPVNPAYDARVVARRQIRVAMKMWGVKF